MGSNPSVFLELFGSCKYGSIMSKNLIFFLLSLVHGGFGAKIVRLSSHPVRAFQGSDALFQWILNKHRPARHDFQRLVFGIWRNGYLSSYILSVTKDGEVIPNPSLRDEFPSLAERVQWKGDLAKSIAAFQVSQIEAEDQMDYGLRLEFFTLRDSQSDFLSLRVEVETKSAITAILSPPLSEAPGSNTSFRCEFQVGDPDKSVYDGITVGTWKRGGIYMTLLTLTKNETIILNPKLDQEVPKYIGRVQAKIWSIKTNNTSALSIEFRDLRQSDEKTYGCRMFFGPFQGSLGASVWINVEDHSEQYESRMTEESFEIRVRESVRLPCQALSEVIQLDGAFKVVYWSYCSSQKCHGEHIKWSWVAGMNRTGITRVNDTGPYGNRTTMFSNGSLEIVNVNPSDETVYRCTVERINYASPHSRFFLLKIDSRVPPKITSRSPDEVKVHEGNVLYLKCDAKGMPAPIKVWSRDGQALENTTLVDDHFILENATKADAGAYMCVASNSVGSDSYMVIVTILPTEGPGPTSISTKEGLSGGEIAVIVVALVVVLSIAVILYCVWRNKARHDRQARRGKNAVNGTGAEVRVLYKAEGTVL
ncbi:uncharacterized protein [Montipora capricornis]|uniref:uncharacterized protein isoform X2 n=1 Tax=Montipora capricornis TaxID=246305 RepID=UPI0035F16A23